MTIHCWKIQLIILTCIGLWCECQSLTKYSTGTGSLVKPPIRDLIFWNRNQLNQNQSSDGDLDLAREKRKHKHSHRHHHHHRGHHHHHHSHHRPLHLHTGYTSGYPITGIGQFGWFEVAIIVVMLILLVAVIFADEYFHDDYDHYDEHDHDFEYKKDGRTSVKLS